MGRTVIIVSSLERAMSAHLAHDGQQTGLVTGQWTRMLCIRVEAKHRFGRGGVLIIPRLVEERVVYG